ncbi:MAG: ATP-binding protein [Clostridiales bacterium]|nr:ATP-binding protein [Clostridiales bacterium]
MKFTKQITTIEYEDLQDFPTEESNYIEYKSSKVNLDNLKNKISVAASSFWNSGGGIFVAGVNDDGKVDGGIPSTKGRQGIRDWADKVIKMTEPLGEYEISIVEQSDNTPDIKEGNVVLLIRFYESDIPPHMAYDKKYYIRAGAHSDGATHFQVEALRALRQFTKPNIKGVLRNHPTKPRIEELLIVSINDAVALDTKLSFDPYPLALRDNFKNEFPLEIPVIDRNNPFRMDISGFGFREQAFGMDPVKLLLEYKDVLGNKYTTEQLISPHKNLQPMSIGEDVNERLVKAIEALAKKIR